MTTHTPLCTPRGRCGCGRTAGSAPPGRHGVTSPPPPPTARPCRRLRVRCLLRGAYSCLPPGVTLPSPPAHAPSAATCFSHHLGPCGSCDPHSVRGLKESQPNQTTANSPNPATANPLNERALSPAGSALAAFPNPAGGARWGAGRVDRVSAPGIGFW